MSPARAPAFWWRAPGWQSTLLAPAAAFYGVVSGRRMQRAQPVAVPAAVLCIGNFTVGGGGKTPTALAFARAAQSQGLRPGFLSRGHGGTARGPLLVDPARHDSALVGDEPLLLAAAAPTVVARERAAGARLLMETGCDLVIMDDGFQSRHLAIDHALIAVDGSRGLGNALVVPAGPLRAPLAKQMPFADTLLVIGEGEGRTAAVRAGARAGRAVLHARLVPAGAELSGRRVLAFAGIAHPGKFHRTLGEMGAEIVASRDFPDHHPFTDIEIEALLRKSEREGLTLATTRKDAARLKGRGPAAERLLQVAQVVDVDLVFEIEDAPARVLRQTLEAYRARLARSSASSEAAASR